jgi:hypothetical protein
MVFIAGGPLHVDQVPWVLLYVGPDVFMPFLSALAAVAGFLLMFWQRVVGFVGRVLGRGMGRTARPEQTGQDKRG